jgi:hypothetical protein
VRAFGAVGGVAGAFHGQFGGAQGSGASYGHLVRGGQRQGEVIRADRGQQRVGDRVVHGRRTHRSAVRGGRMVGA